MKWKVFRLLFYIKVVHNNTYQFIIIVSFPTRFDTIWRGIFVRGRANLYYIFKWTSEDGEKGCPLHKNASDRKRWGPYLQSCLWWLGKLLIFQLYRAQVVSHVGNIWIRPWENFPPIHCRVPAGWGLQRTILAPGSDKTQGQGSFGPLTGGLT